MCSFSLSFAAFDDVAPRDANDILLSRQTELLAWTRYDTALRQSIWEVPCPDFEWAVIEIHMSDNGMSEMIRTDQLKWSVSGYHALLQDIDTRRTDAYGKPLFEVSVSLKPRPHLKNPVYLSSQH